MKRRKNIDLQEDTLKRLNFLAISQGTGVKEYIEQSLDRLAASLNEDMLLAHLAQAAEANKTITVKETAEVLALLNPTASEQCE